ncbi:MAG: ABC transporter ATP-binding protein [Bacteroidales bacterium]
MNNPSTEINVHIKNLTKKFGNFTAVDAISLDVKKGEIFGFLGANGAGKTTAMRMLCGLSYATSGEGTVGGFDINNQQEKIKRNIGYMSQKFSLYEDLTVFENIRFYASVYGLSSTQIKESTKNLLTKLGMTKHENTLVKSLPLGWKQKLAFSIAVIHNPKIIFLDEPTGGVDPVTRRSFWNLIYETAEKGTTVFVTTHYMDEAEYCDRISLMVNGKIMALGSPDKLKEEFKVKNMNELFYLLARDTSTL